MKKIFLEAFSLVELMITLIVVSIITAAMAPVITKRLKSKEITVISGGGGSGEVSTDCAGLFNEDCKLCNINFCLECEKTCEDGFYKNISRCNCTSCTSYDSACATCDSIGCLTCNTDYKLENGVCKMNVITREFTTAGSHEFVVPQGVTQMEVALISGGGGGGGGAALTKTETFVVSGSGNSANNEDNLLHVNSNGVFTWTIPALVRGKNVTVDACGGGGGGGKSSAGGRGGIINNVSIPMPNETTIGIIVGGGGGGPGQNGSCAYGGAGGHTYSASGGTRGARRTSCNAAGSWGSGGGWYEHMWAYGGYDPLFNEHGIGGGGAWCNSGDEGCAGAGSKVGGGGGGAGGYGDTDGAGGGGGGATLFMNSNLALVQAYVAPGGGGGTTNGTGTVGGYGGGGGGIGGGAGANSPTSASASVSAGSNGTGNGTNIFGNNYCAGGAAWTNGKNGAMRITYYDKPNGGSGGGGGQIVPNQIINVTPNDTLTITVGAGGTGGAMNSQGGAGGVSKIVNSSGVTLISTLGNIATGGYSDGTTAGTAGATTNGKAAAEITSTSITNTSGATTTTTTGGAGGKTVIDGSEIHCSAGGGGSLDNPGGAATGYGGCGGGGGGAGASGGNGANGYVKIKYGG